ncbi:MAG: PspC domain-containing protein [Acidobacteriota bacterium]|nr:PspC domain-containing protein [Acidobacteriota bacterium]MDH3784455.1 PspC domain-containing protein [Acidobacteriota bacterium]
MTQEPRRLYRSRRGQILGICAGLGEYFDRDPVLFRLAWAVVTLTTAVVPGLLAYGVAWLIMPAEPIRLPRSTTAAPSFVDPQP